MSADRKKTVIVMPCYNEAERLPTGVISSFIGENHGRISLILVNDGSSDSTRQVIEAMAADNPHIMAVNLPRNSGKAEAVRQGVLAALELPCEFIGFWDADMATPFSELDRMSIWLEHEGIEVVTGCRLARLGARVIRSLSRHYLGRVFATVVSNMLGVSLYDSQCGAKLFRREIAEKVFAAPFVSPWLFDVEIFRRIIMLYGRERTERMVYEYPLFQWEDVAGSKLTFGKMLKTPLELWKIFRS